jgi:hypothetical protein
VRVVHVLCVVPEAGDEQSLEDGEEQGQAVALFLRQAGAVFIFDESVLHQVYFLIHLDKPGVIFVRLGYLLIEKDIFLKEKMRSLVKRKQKSDKKYHEKVIKIESSRE